MSDSQLKGENRIIIEIRSKKKMITDRALNFINIETKISFRKRK